MSTIGKIKVGGTIYDIAYPIGSIYLSVNETSPAEVFGGTWEQLKDRFLLAAGDTYAAGSTGGEAQHFLSIPELPEHRMNIYDQETGDTSASLCPDLSSIGVRNALLPASSGIPSRAIPGKRYWYSSTMPVGENKGHNNMPPYLSVYMWKRIA